VAKERPAFLPVLWNQFSEASDDLQPIRGGEGAQFDPHFFVARHELHSRSLLEAHLSQLLDLAEIQQPFFERPARRDGFVGDEKNFPVEPRKIERPKRHEAKNKA
jgi:hypothetical protein